jgi:3-hydroxybutyryl-CoA dehydrogenase
VQSSPGHDFTIAVIGAGPQGAELALLAIRAGFRTVIEDVLPSRLRNLRERVELERNGSAGDRIVFAGSIEDAVRDADFAIDSVPDELESKLEIFSLLDRMAPPKTVICSPLEFVSLSDLASCTYRADRCIGVRGVAGETVQLIRGRLTSEETMRTAAGVWQQMRKQVEVVVETAMPGFGG